MVDGAVRPSAAGGEDGIEMHDAERPATQDATATVTVLANEGQGGRLRLANAATGDGYRISFQNDESGYWLVGLGKSAGEITTEYGWISVAWGTIGEGDVIEVRATGNRLRYALNDSEDTVGALGRTPTPPYEAGTAWQAGTWSGSGPSACNVPCLSGQRRYSQFGHRRDILAMSLRASRPRPSRGS